VNVVADTNLAGQHHVIARDRAAGDADLRADHIVFSDPAIVGNHHQVIDLGPITDDRGSISAAIDGRAGADLAVGADFDVP
jgi:hypothetical protein